MGVPAYQLLTPGYARQVLGVGDQGEAADLAYRLGGRAVKPVQEIVMRGPAGNAVVICGMGAAEAAELQDIAEAVYEEQQAKVDAGEPIVNFDELRERHGLPSREEFDPLFRQALRDRIEQHRRNPITDPARQPHKKRGYVGGADLSSEEEEAACPRS